jgi:hypothetical protein
MANKLLIVARCGILMAFVGEDVILLGHPNSGNEGTTALLNVDIY